MTGDSAGEQAAEASGTAAREYIWHSETSGTAMQEYIWISEASGIAVQE